MGGGVGGMGERRGRGNDSQDRHTATIINSLLDFPFVFCGTSNSGLNVVPSAHIFGFLLHPRKCGIGIST